MIQQKPLTDSQHLGWDKFCDERTVISAKEGRFLASCLRELGGKLNEGWQFDHDTRTFWRNVSDEPITDPMEKMFAADSSSGNDRLRSEPARVGESAPSGTNGSVPAR